MSHVTITIDEQDLPAVLAILREKGIAVAGPRTDGGSVVRSGRRLPGLKVMRLAAESAKSTTRTTKPSAA